MGKNKIVAAQAPILFLDIDGVVNNQATMARFQGFVGIDPGLASIIKRIISESGCEVVLSSTWRLDAPFRAEVRKKVCKFIDVTPDKRGLTDRGCEVIEWMNQHPEVTVHAILDDNSDFHKEQPFFKTDTRIGITDEIADAVIKHLSAA